MPGLAFLRRSIYIALQQRSTRMSRIRGKANAMSKRRAKISEPPSRKVHTMTDNISAEAAAQEAKRTFRRRPQFRKDFVRYDRAGERARSCREEVTQTPRLMSAARMRSKRRLTRWSVPSMRPARARPHQPQADRHRPAESELRLRFRQGSRGCQSVGEIAELQSAYIRSQFKTFANQATEIRALSAKIAADTAEPIKAQMSRSIETVRRN